MMQDLGGRAALGGADHPARRTIGLDGAWERWHNGRLWDLVTVPCSLAPSGVYRLRKKVTLPAMDAGTRVFLCFEGIAYFGTVSVNGRRLGAMGAYVPHEFDATAALQGGDNQIEVEICDLTPGPDGAGAADVAIGVNPGWEAYGGIIRDTYLELRPAAFIEDVAFQFELSDDFARAACTAQVSLSSAASGAGELTVTLLFGNAVAAQATSPVEVETGHSAKGLAFECANPWLWSPDQPHLYRLETTLKMGAGQDVHTCRTGFRHFRIDGPRFLWNGKPLVLQGFCRHDMWSGQGFTLTRTQMRQDMQAIKQTGANFVRLVHYPHHRYVIDLAEEFGLLVTEEPGYWQVEFPSMPPAEVAAGLRILEGAIRRDRNSPAVFGWFLGNESRLTVDYLRQGKEMCNRADPWKRPVSFANSTATEKAKVQFEEAGLDFFSQHLYDFDSRKFAKTVTGFGPGKPISIDEWGWEDAGRGQIFWERNFDRLLEAVQQGQIAAHAFWSWNDVRQYARIDWPTQDGVLLSGVVTETREPRPELYTRLTRLFRGEEQNPESALSGHDTPASDRPRLLPLRSAVIQGKGDLRPADLQPVADRPESARAWEFVDARMKEFWAASSMGQNQWERTGRRMLFWKGADLVVSGIPFRCALRDGYATPVVLVPDAPEVRIPLDSGCEALYVLGNVTLPSGYPLEGRRKAIAANYELHFSGGRTEVFPQRNGIEVARANRVHEATLICPLATAAPAALLFEKDPAREHYQVLLHTIVPRRPDRIVEMRCRLESGPPLAIFAITVQGTGRNA
ncbi:MAG TPA: glycoside hydrolase family 2 TIM barrel-domain containing protein [Bryobacteraceae bacterium]|jgi:hypothetical protein|nr:glycoside hydrolase family 2 TIM barrel-domain containing protein [Bryobacteraceae bacterium]